MTHAIICWDSFSNNYEEAYLTDSELHYVECVAEDVEILERWTAVHTFETNADGLIGKAFV